MSCAGGITELVQALPCVSAAMRCHLMRAGNWPPQPFRGPLLFVTPSGLQFCQLSLKHGGSSIKFKKTSILKVLPESLHLSGDKGSYTRDMRVHQSVVNERLNTALHKCLQHVFTCQTATSQAFPSTPHSCSACVCSRMTAAILSTAVKCSVQTPCISPDRNTITDPSLCKQALL